MKKFNSNSISRNNKYNGAGGAGGGGTASDIAYDNSLSGLVSENVQQAIDELHDEIEIGNIYSTDEKKIGEWLDGSPIYQRSYQYDIPTSHTGEMVLCTDNNFGKILKIETLVSSENYADTLNGCPNILDQANNTIIIYQSGKSIKAKRSRDGLWNDGWTITVTVNYLK